MPLISIRNVPRHAVGRQNLFKAVAATANVPVESVVAEMTGHTIQKVVPDVLLPLMRFLRIHCDEKEAIRPIKTQLIDAAKRQKKDQQRKQLKHIAYAFR